MVHDALGFCAVLQTGGVFGPLNTDVLYELGIELFRRCAAFSPVENELRYCRVYELRIDPTAGHDFQCIG